jgi:hypothetical protein
MKRLRKIGFKAFVLALTVLATSCSIPEDRSPRQIRSDVVPVDLTSPTRKIDIYVVSTSGSSGTGLSKIQRTAPLRTDRAETVRDAIAQLRAPLSVAETAQGFRSDLSRYEFEGELQNGIVTLDITRDPEIKTDGTLLGQIVLTLGGLDGVELVDVIENGQTVPEVRGANLEPLTPPLTADMFAIFSRRQETAKLYFVRNGLLEPVDRVVAAPETLDNPDLAASKYLEPLADGPTAEQLSQGYKTLLKAPAPVLIGRTGVLPFYSSYFLQFEDSFAELSANDQALAIGQALYTIDGWSRASVGKVEIQVAGVTLRSVPLPRGKTTTGLVDKTMYRALLADKR